jgi:hypothetical protein
VHFLFETVKSRLTDKPGIKGSPGQALIGIVVSQTQPIFSTARKHAIWLFRPFSDEIIN